MQYAVRTWSKKRSRSEASLISPYDVKLSGMLNGSGLEIASSTAVSSGVSYLTAIAVSSWTTEYESVRSSGGKLVNISSARYYVWLISRGIRVYTHSTTDLREITQFTRIRFAIFAIGNLNDRLDLILPTFDSFLRLRRLRSKSLDHDGRQAVSERLEIGLLIFWYHLSLALLKRMLD